MEKVKNKCCASIYSAGTYRHYQCSKGAKYEHEGKHYCGTHHPPAVRAKADSRRAKFDAEMQRKTDLRVEAIAQANEAEHRADCYPVLLAALKEAVECGMVPTSSASDGGASKYSRQVHAADMIRAAIAKAEGGAL